MGRTFKKAIRTFHVWAGLTIGALFCLMSLSGSVLVLRPAIEDQLRPGWTPKSAARPSQVLTEAARNIAIRWPSAKIASISFPVRTGLPIEFAIRTAAGPLRVFADARSGEVLGAFTLSWLDWLTDLHHHLQVESIGKKIVGSIGIALFLSSLTGLMIWAIRPARWARLFGKRTLASRPPTSFDWHRSVGVVGNVLLLFVSATGITIAFPQTIERLMGGPVGPPPPRRMDRLAADPRAHAALEQYMAAANRAVRGGTVRQLRLAASPDRPVTARLSTPGDLRLEGSTRVSLEAGTARVIAIERPEDLPLPNRIVQAATPLHYGEWGGTSVRILWFFIGLMPAVLFVSGIWMWWGPVKARRSAVRRYSRGANTSPAAPTIPDLSATSCSTSGTSRPNNPRDRSHTCS